MYKNHVKNTTKLMKEVKDLNREIFHFSYIIKPNILKMSVPPDLIFGFNTISIKTPGINFSGH